jgi:GTP-binding protein EngB required for normal cell division
VLIDAGSTLTADDLQTIAALQQAAIPVNVLLSKADLLSAGDRQQLIQYVTQHIAFECRMELTVHRTRSDPAEHRRSRHRFDYGNHGPRSSAAASAKKFDNRMKSCS